MRIVFYASFLFAITTPIFAQADPVTTLLAKFKLSNAPLSYQSALEPGSLLAIDRSGAIQFIPAGPMVGPLVQELPPVTVGEQDLALTSGGDFAAKFLQWSPGVGLKSDKTLKSDQAVFSVKWLPEPQLEQVISGDPATQAISTVICDWAGR